MRCRKYHIVVIRHKTEFYTDDYDMALSILETYPHATIYQFINGIYRLKGDVKR
jgi:hypothetical protein